MDSVGICGSDVHYLEKGRIGDFILTTPMIIGHEASGVVHQVGKSVKNLKVGDRVAIEPGVPCRYCEFCKTGKYNLCPDMIFCATPPCHGNLARYYAHAADFCFKLPDHVTMEEGALLEPLSVGIHACNRANVKLGTKVLILGAGPIGLASLIAAKSMGAGEIVITDLAADRLELAKSDFNADHIVNATDMNESEMVKKIHNALGGIGPDVTIDCGGFQVTNRIAILATKPGGCVVIVGCGPTEVSIPLINACAREIDIRGVFRYCNDYPAALALVASGKINVKKLVTHHFDIKDTKDAFETSRLSSRNGAIKVMIHCTSRNENNPKPF